MLRELNADIADLTDIADIIDRAIVEEPPFSVREGGMIKDGFNSELDELRDIVNNGKAISPRYSSATEKTGIKKD